MSTSSASPPSRAMLPVVAMALFIDSLGIGIIIPIAPQLVMELSGATLAEAAPIAGWLTLAYASMQFIFSPILGNLSDRYGRKPILLASLAALSVDYVLMGLAPTLAWLFTQRRAFSVRRANVLGALKSLRVIPGAALLLVVLFFYQIGHDTLPSTWTWTVMAKFDWTERDVGLSLAALGLGTAVVQGGLVGMFTRKLGEHRTAIIGMTGGALGFLGYAFASSPAMLFASIPLGCLLGLTMPSIRAMLSRRVPANAQGELQGAISGIVSFTAIVAPFAMTHLFSIATSRFDFAGASFFAAAFVLLAGAIMLLRRGPTTSV
jgi:DHA1 family tetracycline resistance protein-like MFS transporter